MTEKKREAGDCGLAYCGQSQTECRFDPVGSRLEQKNLLLHSCCGPCSTAVIERLLPDYSITVFFYNPCITDREEYEKRKAEQIRFIDAVNRQAAGARGHVTFVEGDYDPERYLERVRGLEQEPEGGARCTVCFQMRLARTAAFAAEHGYPIFGTTLTVSPHKDYRRISEIGRTLATEFGIEYLDRDFKKKAGCQRSVQLSREYGLYRQNYCGCLFSKND